MKIHLRKFRQFNKMEKDKNTNFSHPRTRNLYLDISKGIAIILVVFGHNIQYGSFVYKDDSFFNDPLFMAIYSFHMPLFMLISGYLFYYSIISHSWNHNFKSRFTKLVFPIIIWNSIYIAIIAPYLLWKGSDISWTSLLASYLSAIWFLWAIFWCSMISLIVHRYFRDSVIVYVFVGILALFLPKIFEISLYVYMYPYFVMGYLFNKYKLSNTITAINNNTRYILSAFLFVIFIGLYLLYTKEDYIYMTGTGIVKYTKGLNPEIDLHQLSIDIFRYSIGLVGSVCTLIVIRTIYKRISKNAAIILGEIGKKSIGIYIISTMFINGLVLTHLSHREDFGYGAVAIETIIIIAITYLLTSMIEKNKLTRYLMLGSR